MPGYQKTSSGKASQSFCGRRKAVKVRRYRGACASKSDVSRGGRADKSHEKRKYSDGQRFSQASFCFFGCLHRLVSVGRGNARLSKDLEREGFAKFLRVAERR